MIGEEKGSVAISGRSSHKMTGLRGPVRRYPSLPSLVQTFALLKIFRSKQMFVSSRKFYQHFFLFNREL